MRNIHKPSISIAFVLVVLLGINCYAQDQPQTLAGSSEMRFSGFGGPMFEIANIGGQSAFGAGGGGGLLINNAFYFGGFGTGISRNNVLIGSEPSSIELGYGGLWLGYIIKPNSLVHAVVNTKFGWGTITETPNNIPLPVSENVSVIQPQLELELNLTLWMKFNAGVGYKFVTGQSSTQTNLEGMVGTFSLLFGWFGNNNWTN